jgi:adenine-specific DNA-methyltransferase
MTLPPPECRVYTPPQLADAMVQAIDPNPHDDWLDPCMGPGAFITCLRKKGITREHIVGIDIDPHSGAEDNSATTVRGIDFFNWCASTAQKFSRIVANPPYVAIRKLHPTLQQSLRAFGSSGDSSFAPRSNYWCAFLSACLRLLSNNGSLSFVLPAAWDYALYASDVRRAIHQQFQSVEVHRSHEPLFPHVREGCVVLVAKGYRKVPLRSVRINHPNAHSLISALRQGDGKPATCSAPTRDPSHTPFSDLYTVRIGCVTGNAEYFLLRESDRIRLGLPRDSVSPVLSKARHLTSAYMTAKQWERLLATDERVWLFNPEPRVMRQKAVQAYLAHGLEECDLEAYKLRNRDPWYRVPDVRNAVSGFLSGMTKLGPWISFRSKRQLAATNTLYALIAKNKMSAEERASWALSLISTSPRRQFHAIARRYPDGLAKLEPRDLNSLRLPAPLRTKGAPEEYERAISYLVTGKVGEAIAIADQFIRRL